MLRLKLLAVRALCAATLSIPVAAAASQGPGVGAGSAGHFTQLAMAVIVYGGCGLIVAAGLIGGLRTQVR